MKQILLLAAVLLTAQSAFSQSSLTEFIEQHSKTPGFTYAFLSKDLFEVTIKADVDQKDWKKVQQVVENFGSLQILVADSTHNGNALYKDAVALVPKDDLDELISVQDGDDKVRMWIREQDNTVSDLVLAVGTMNDFVLICFSGKLDLANIMGMAELFNGQEAKSLAKTAEEVSLKFNVFPNPSSGNFTVQYTDTADKAELLNVFDKNGKMVAEFRMDGQNEKNLSLYNLENGTYWFQLKSKSGKVGIVQVQLLKKS